MKTRKRPFGARDKFGYLFGDFGNDFTFLLSTMVLMKFYTDILGVSAAAVGTIMMIARFADAFTDVTMGRLCDRAKGTRAGKFKPWLLRMCGPVAIASFLMYQNALASTPMSVRVGYLFVTYILWGSVFYTAVNIPYGSMASAVSADPDDRQSLSTFRTMGATLAGLVIGVSLPLFAYEKRPVIDPATGEATLNAAGEPLFTDVLVGSRVTRIAGVFSLLAVVCYLLCYFMVTERVRPEVPPKVHGTNSVGRMLGNALKNRALLSIIAASVVMLLAQLTMQNMAAYVFPDYYRNASAQSLSTVTMVLGMVAAAVVAKPAAKRFGKAEVSVVSNLFAAAVCLLLFLLRPQNVWVYVGLQALCWLGLGIFSMVNWALITDVIDYSELKNGVREDGAVYALYSFARKLGQAVAAGLSGWLLTLIGYDTTRATQGLQQSDTVLSGIFNISTLVPAVGFLALALVLWFWYPLHKTQVDANVTALKEKHNRGE